MFSTSNLTNVFGAAVFFATSGRTQQKTKAVHYILLRKMFSTAVQKCIFAKQHNARQIDAPSNKNVTSKKEGFLYAKHIKNK